MTSQTRASSWFRLTAIAVTVFYAFQLWGDLSEGSGSDRLLTDLLMWPVSVAIFGGVAYLFGRIVERVRSRDEQKPAVPETMATPPSPKWSEMNGQDRWDIASGSIFLVLMLVALWQWVTS
jgi:hypothetical protein